ncbi:hypothetical protein GCM10009117_09810 [Gangjinia marincola]|uniref:DUF4105 domain-containing protein n=1 Tax=Gangjinia marincola TaxID=578463 RepID=A0ABN1MFD5_9FLAO
MKQTLRTTLTLGLFILIYCSTFAQDKKFIAFCADSSGIGHAFISLGYEDSQRLMTVNEGSWGLYPKESLSGGKSLIMGEVPGKIVDDFLRTTDLILVVTVTDEEYNDATSKLNEWRTRNYELLESDCLTFLIDVANILSSKLDIPKRKGFENHPAKFLEKLIGNNN